MLDKISTAVAFIRSLHTSKAKTGAVLGSGLGDYVNGLSEKVEIPYSSIPGFASPSVKGHDGKLVFGKIDDTEIVILQGRFHAYEGLSLDEVVFPIRVLKFLGVENIILTNASGGINSAYSPGDFVIIEDHINMTGDNPLLGKNLQELGERFPDMTDTYCAQNREALKRAFDDLNITVHQGIYAGVLGPSYETPAEVRMLRILGADLVGMSTIYEAIAAHHMGVKVSAIACVTNMAAGMLEQKLDHDDVKEVAGKVMQNFQSLLNQAIKRVEETCGR